MATAKQIAANQKNGKKGGVKTEQGKAAIKWNAVKHGLLVREAVIDAGEGRESRKDFESFLGQLWNHFSPLGIVEEMLVEQVATQYWRHRRVIRREIGLLRRGLDRYKSDYFKDGDDDVFSKKSRTHKDVEKEIERIDYHIDGFKNWDRDKNEEQCIDPGIVESEGWNIDLKTYYRELVLSDESIPWEDDFGDRENIKPKAVYQWLRQNGWTVKKIRSAFVEIGKKLRKEKEMEVQQAKRDDAIHLDQVAKSRALLSGPETDTLIRYETAIMRQFYRALHELERVQMTRKGQNVPPPLVLDIEGDGANLLPKDHGNQ